MQTLRLNSSILLVLDNNKIATIIKTDDPEVWKAINPYTGEENEITYDEAKSYFKELTEPPTNPEYITKRYSDEEIDQAIDSILLGENTGASRDLINRLQYLETKQITPGGTESLTKKQLTELQETQKHLQKQKSKELKEIEEQIYTPLKSFRRPGEEGKKDEEEQKQRKEDIQVEKIRERIRNRIKALIPPLAQSIQKYQNQKKVQLSDNQKRNIMRQTLEKNEIGVGAPEEKKEELLNEAMELLSQETSTSKIMKIIPDFAERIRKYEEQKDLKLTDAQKKVNLEKLLDKYLTDVSEEQRQNILNSALEALNNELISTISPADEKMAGVFTIEDLIRLGATEKFAVGLVEMPAGEKKQVLDEATNESINIEKRMSDAGEELYVIEDDEGKKAVKSDNPAMQELSQSGIVVEGFTENHRKILAELGFTI